MICGIINERNLDQPGIIIEKSLIQDIILNEKIERGIINQRDLI